MIKGRNQGLAFWGPYFHETLLVCGVQSARSISLDKVVNPKMGLEGNSLVVLNSLGQDVKTLVHFVCTRPDVAIVRYHDDGPKESILTQATPLEHELEVANWGLSLISFQALVLALGKSQFWLQVCVLTHTHNRSAPAAYHSLLGLHSPSTRYDRRRCSYQVWTVVVIDQS
jgi:hypothetical protein